MSAVCILQHGDIVDNELLKSGTLAFDAEYMSPVMKDSMWYVKSGIESVKVNMERVFVSSCDVDIVASTSDLYYSMSNMTQKDVIEKEPFELGVNDYKNILCEISRRESIDLETGCSDEIKAVEIEF
eukprot:15324217-Ditylum_brightwellii.AAC.1